MNEDQILMDNFKEDVAHLIGALIDICFDKDEFNDEDNLRTIFLSHLLFLCNLNHYAVRHNISYNEVFKLVMSKVHIVEPDDSNITFH